MMITVDISPEVEAELARKAAARGVDVPAFVATLIEQAAQPEPARPKYQRPPGRKSLAQLFAESPFAGLGTWTLNGTRIRAVTSNCEGLSPRHKRPIRKWTRPHPQASVSRWLDEANDDELYFSVVSLGEILKGITALPEGKRRSDLQFWLDDTLRPWFQGRMLPVTGTDRRTLGRAGRALSVRVAGAPKLRTDDHRDVKYRPGARSGRSSRGM